jgi:hypothetical protein
MNQKQLANVLVKVLGLSLGVEGTMRVVYAIVNLMVSGLSSKSSGVGMSFVWLLNSFSGFLLAAIGVFFIIRSRWLVEKLFKNEEE